MTRHWQMYGNRGDLMDSLLQVNRTNQLPMLLGWLILRPRTVALATPQPCPRHSLARSHRRQAIEMFIIKRPALQSIMAQMPLIG